jgi:hypothetical protein
MLKAIRVSAMLLALVGSAYAGEVLTPPAPQPPPTSAVQEPTDGATLNGDISTPDVSESLTQITLELLAVLPSIF